MPRLAELQEKAAADPQPIEEADALPQETLVGDTRSRLKSPEVIEQKLHAALERGKPMRTARNRPAKPK